jgi:hypothetical protein
MRYWPLPSVVVVRVFSMRAGLDASIVTPGSTPPDASRTVPASVACACASAGKRSRAVSTQTAFENCRIYGSSVPCLQVACRHELQARIA